ncbi:zinc finger protein 576, tandem duplicate 1 [Brachionichthys hirsutus]|uniref:zinc finger protein 576, tandem duplicate 1 n=1 Tax=Brachionichthys hirsutus TaxID=412623 RepID=UPI0036046914
MQSPAEAVAGPKPASSPSAEKLQNTATGAQAAQRGPDAPEEESKSAIPPEMETMTPRENGTAVRSTEASEHPQQQQQPTGPSHNTGAKKGAPIRPVPGTDAKPRGDGPKTKKTDKAARDGRKFVLSKRAMTDPLKMDMSKPLVVPLTSSELSLQCIECHIIFSDHKSKERHLKLSHPAEYEQCILRNALFACYVCDRFFTNSTELMAHQKAHVDKMPFKCPICSQAFKKSSELTVHKKIHFGLDGYACTDCGKSCKTMTLLKYHSRTHTGERPYICKECGKRFTMSKAMQKHMASHFPEGAEGEAKAKAKAKVKKDNGASTKYPCPLCKATFKSTKTQQHHMKVKHKLLPARTSNALAAGQQGKQNTPIITPIPFCQQALLQVEPNGPLQKVDADIDTEQLRRLIESLGNVQKVNQVVILGQVPPHAPPLEVHQLPQVAEPANLNLNPLHIDFMGLKQNESNTVELAQSNVLRYMQELIGSMYDDDFPIQTRPAKRQRSKKSHLVVKFGPQSKEKNKPKKSSQQHALLLLKGHKQPQLKVYKLDSSKSSSQTNETSPQSQAASQQSKGRVKGSKKNLTADGKKKGGRPKKSLKALSLLSSLQVSCQSSETLPPKQKATRKRKASSKVETEGVITSHSKRALECKDCGERFREVSSLQKHKATVHITESPGLTYTNGNIFEGVSKSDLYRLPKQHDQLAGMINAATDWDTEPETKSSEKEAPLALGEGKREEGAPKDVSSEAKVPGAGEEDIKEDLLLEVDLVTVGEQNESHEPTSPEVAVPQIESNGPSRGQTESEKEQDECQIVYEMHPVTSDTEVNCEVEESPEEQVVFELKSVTTSVEDVMRQRDLQGGEKDDRDQSPGIILEKFLTSRQRTTWPVVDQQTNNDGQGLENSDNEVQVLEKQKIKVEESLSDPLAVAAVCQNGQTAAAQPQQHRDIRTVLVKEESARLLDEVQSMQSSRHVQWTVEPVDNEDTSSPLIDGGETIRDSHSSPEFNSSQCIFYPVKQEEREVLLGSSQSIDENTTTGTSSDIMLTDHQDTDSNLDLRDFLLQSSDEEDAGGFELADPQLDSEAGIMSYFYKNQTSDAQRPDEMSQNLSNSVSQLQTPSEGNKTREPIEYFSEYFGGDTWVEISRCTNTLSKLPNPVTDREVAQFVGIHIAMGTLKFPSLRLYWKDLTKVPLIADTMPLSRFQQLTHILKFAAKDSVSSNSRDGRHDHAVQNAEQTENPSQHSNKQTRDMQNDPRSSTGQTDPLWKARPLLSRFTAGCRSLRRDHHYAIDQYPLALTRKIHNDTPSLNATTLVGFGGFLLNVDLKFSLSGKEDAIEKMAPKGSTVYLCKQELSTPAMLERLLAAGVHGAGRVGGARGQIGDEFVSSDGKLMLRRSHWGFILSTAGNTQRNVASLIDNFEKAQMSAHVCRDLRNLYSIPLATSAPTCWPQAVLWYLTDLALVNSWLLYRQDRRGAATPLTLMDFRLEVSKALVLSSGADSQDSIPPQPPIEKTHGINDAPNPSLLEESPLPDAATRYDGSGHWPEQLGEGAGGRCRFRDCQRTSRVLCLKCCVFLCISRNHNCFLNFHNQGSVEKE